MTEIDFAGMNDHDILVVLAVRSGEIKEHLAKLEEHVAETNSTVAENAEARIRTDAAVGVLRWVVASLILAVSAAASVAGVGVAIAALGGGGG